MGVFVTRLLNAIATLYIARTLGPTDYGVLSFGVSLALLLSVSANIGLEDLIVRDIARKSKDVDRLLGDALVFKTLIAPLGVVAILLLTLYDASHSLLFAFLVSYSLLHSFLLIFCATFRGLERMEFQMLLLTGQMLLIAAGSVLAVWLTGNVTVVASCYLVASSVGVLLGYGLLLRKGIRPTYQWQPDRLKRLFFRTLPFGLVFVSLLLYERLASILVATLSGETAAGWFNAVYNLVLILIVFPSIVAATTFPLVARKAQEQSQALSKVAANLVKYVTVVSLGLSIVLYVAAPSLVLFFFGEAYRPSISLLQIFAASIPFVFLNVTLIGVLEAMGWQRQCAKNIGYALLVAVPMCLGAIGLWGYRGGALAYLANHVILTGVVFSLTIRALGRFDLRQIFGLPVLTGMVAVVIVYFGRYWSLFLLLPALGFAYLGMLVLNLLLNPTELSLVRGAWQSQSWRRRLLS